MLYRSIQDLHEALTNVSRHARATSVEVELLMDAEDVVLRVADDGVGMTPADRSKPNAFGPRGMTERVRALNGKVTLAATASGGTQLNVRVPASAHYTPAHPGSRVESADG